MLIRHLLYPSELSSLVGSTGLEPVPPGFPGALTHELRSVHAFVQRNTATHCVPRQPVPHEPAHGADRRAALMTQVEIKCKKKILRSLLFPPAWTRLFARVKERSGGATAAAPPRARRRAARPGA